ncbi:unnamed protein product, partial [Meganyctiphanes norvegica]
MLGSDELEYVPWVGNGELPEESLSDHYDILNIISYGRMGKIYLAAERTTGAEVALKAVCRDMCRRRDVQKEYSYALGLQHPNLVMATARLFQTDLYLVFPVEYAPYGDLGALLVTRKLEDNLVRRLAEQVSCALMYMHSLGLVHGDITPENIFLFRPNISHIKIGDFGCTSREGSYVRRGFGVGSYTPPELTNGEPYYTFTAQDSWSVGILLLHCLTGSPPWVIANSTDPDYQNFKDWQRKKSTRVPRTFKRFTVRILRLLRRLLEPRTTSRYQVKEVFKYVEDDWIIKSRERSDSQVDTDAALAHCFTVQLQLQQRQHQPESDKRHGWRQRHK